MGTMEKLALMAEIGRRNDERWNAKDLHKDNEKGGTKNE